MATTAELDRGLEAHRLQVVPAGGIVRHRYAMVVSQAYAGVLEHAPDRRIEFARDLGLRGPNRLQDGGDVEGRDLMHRTRQQRSAIVGTEVAFPLIPDLGVRRFSLRLSDHHLGHLLERRNRLRSLARRYASAEGVDILRDQLPGVGGGNPRLCQSHGRVRAQAHVVARAIHLISQHPTPAAGIRDDQL